MKIVLAPDSFKESLSARAAALAMERGVKRAIPDAETVVLPIADGGEGTLDTLVFAAGGQLHWTSVTGPLGTPVPARYGTLGDGVTGVVETAEASGLHLVPPEERNPLVTTTRGTGELIRHALDRGLTRLVVAIGGSATNDAGAGALQALGMRLVDQTGAFIGPGGGSLSRLAGIDAATLDPRLDAVDFDAKVQGATAVLTGEGRIDSQTAAGKVIAGLAERAARAGVPVIAFAGCVEPGFEALYERGLLSAHAILSRPASLVEALAGAEANLEAAVFAVARLLAREPPPPPPTPPQPTPAPAKVKPIKTPHPRRGGRSRQGYNRRVAESRRGTHA